MRRLEALALILPIALLSACPAREVAQIDPTQQKTEYKDIPVQLNRDVDLLFMVDNSGSMIEEQTSLVNNFSSFINVLNTIQGGLPNVHIGVITTDLGVGPYATQFCSSTGQGAELQVSPSCGMVSPGDRFLENQGGKVNFSGSAATAAGCLVKAGSSGCGFEQPLEALRLALLGKASSLLRAEAALAVVVLTGDDDCSVKDDSLFDWQSDAFGPYALYRCFQYGVRCDGKEPPLASTSLQSCQPGGSWLYDPSRYTSLLSGLKPAGWLSVLVISAPTQEPLQVYEGTDQYGYPCWKLSPTCQTGDTSGAPAVRLRAFRQGLGAAGLAGDICATSYQPFADELLSRIKAVF